MRFSLSVVTCASLYAALTSSPAEARKPEDHFAGRIVVSDKPFPMRAPSEQAYINAVAGQAKDRFGEDKAEQTWHVHLAAFFRSEPGTIEVKVKVFDITNGQRLVESFEYYLSNNKQRAYLTSMDLKRGDGTQGYDPNSRIKVVMEAGGRPLAEATFLLVGEARKYKGKVTFSEEDVK
jgi:hypothetical protein